MEERKRAERIAGYLLCVTIIPYLFLATMVTGGLMESGSFRFEPAINQFWYFLLVSIFCLFIASGLNGGIGLIRGWDKRHRFALPYAILTFFAFPLGTLAAAYYFWVYIKWSSS